METLLNANHKFYIINLLKNTRRDDDRTFGKDSGVKVEGTQ